MNIVIVAGGLGTRFGNLNVFPKILLPTNKYNSILEEDLSIIDTENNEVFLIINDKYWDMALNYLRVNHLEDKIHLYRTKNVNGSYNSIINSYFYHFNFPTSDILFIWSDIILDKIPEFDHSKNTVFTYTNGQKYRYKIEDNKISLTDDYSGNIPGVYYIKKLKDVFLFEENEFNNYDLVDAIKDSNVEVAEVKLNSLFEYRDYDTYLNKVKEYSDNSLKTRFFNKLEVDNDVLIKTAIDEDYYQIIDKEFDWYKYGNENITDFNTITPKIYSENTENHSFKMEYLKDYVPLHKVLKSIDDEDKVKLIYYNIRNAFDIIHSDSKMVEKEDFFDDLKKEIVTKVIERCDKIKNMLINYDRKHLIDLLEKTFYYLLSLEPNDKVEYSFCHGDLNGSNLLVNPNTLDVKFIDPRGYFGLSKKYGWKPYEYAKLLYCLYGYDDFNNLPQIYTVDEPVKLKWVDSINYLNKKELKVLVGIIYVALAGYISQDIMKANIAYEYGIKLLEEELKK